MLQFFDDGSTIETDSAGNTIRVTDSSGRLVANDTSILQDFARNLLGGASAAVRDYLRPTSSAPVVLSAPSALPAWLLPAGLAVAAFFFFKKSG